MKKVLFIAILFILSGLLSFMSFFYGSVEPEYGPSIGNNAYCQSLAVNPKVLREITYSRGFPIQKTDTIQFDVVCDYANTYAPSPGEIARSWQLYVNWFFYTFLLTSMALGLNKIKKHISSPYDKH